jgi:hypothetical protein
MIFLVAMGWIHLVFVLFLPNIYEICLKQKSEFRIIRKFATHPIHRIFSSMRKRITYHYINKIKEQPPTIFQIAFTSFKNKTT